MDKEALIGDSRSPKFLVCNLCNGRNHKAQQCPCKLCMVQWCQFQHLPTIFDVIIMSLGLDLDIIKITRAALSIGTQTIYSACLGLCNPEHARCLHDDFFKHFSNKHSLSLYFLGTMPIVRMRVSLEPRWNGYFCSQRVQYLSCIVFVDY